MDISSVDLREVMCAGSNELVILKETVLYSVWKYTSNNRKPLQKESLV